jgi:hypothetical protein
LEFRCKKITDLQEIEMENIPACTYMWKSYLKILIKYSWTTSWGLKLSKLCMFQWYFTYQSNFSIHVLNTFSNTFHCLDKLTCQANLYPCTPPPSPKEN